MEDEVPGVRQCIDICCIASKEVVSQWLFFLATQLCARISLVLVQKLGVQLDVPRLVHTVYVPKCSRDAKVRANLA